MKRFLAFAYLLTCFMCSQAQTPAEFVRAVQSHYTSLPALKQVIKKNFAYRTGEYYDLINDSTTFLHHSVLQACFYVRDTTYKTLYFRAVYKNNRVVYVQVEGVSDYAATGYKRISHYKYIDTLYTDSLLNAYNKIHQTDFTWQDLYEDNLDEFVVLPGFMAPKILKDSNGVEIGLAPPEPFLSGYIMDFLPLIKKRDHSAIVKMCKSLNPARKAYGALCLYTLQQLKEPLAPEEKQLIETISHSNEFTKYSPGGCYSSHPKKISTFLTKMDLDHYAQVIIEKAFSDNHF